MRRREFMGALATIVVLGTPQIAGTQGPPPGAGPRGAGRRWDQDAEESFRLGRGLAPRLMTEEEWREHQQKMRTMTGEERQRYRAEVHQKMMERAKQQGIEVPPTPGQGPGRGTGGAAKPGN